MTLVSLIDCCHLLAIDLKTLHRWMTLSRLSAQSHPFDARLKCLTPVQIQQLAATHRRVLPDLDLLRGPSEATTASTVGMSVPPLPDLSLHVTDLTKQLSTLQAQVTMLQRQLTLLTVQLPKEQQWQISQARAFQEQSQDNSQDNSQEQSQDNSQNKSQKPSQDNSQESARTEALAPQRKRSHVLPLVEYGGAEGKYVVISPEQGLLDFEPDSPEWFAWLSTLTSFRFVGPSGHLTVHRDKCRPSWSWRATRSIRYRTHSLHLVRTELLTSAVLEQAAASLQSLLN